MEKKNVEQPPTDVVEEADVETQLPEPPLRYGWQEDAVKASEPCMHTGIFWAKTEIPAHAIGHTWRCLCNALFKIELDLQGKKVLNQIQ